MGVTLLKKGSKENIYSYVYQKNIFYNNFHYELGNSKQNVVSLVLELKMSVLRIVKSIAE